MLGWLAVLDVGDEVAVVGLGTGVDSAVAVVDGVVTGGDEAVEVVAPAELDAGVTDEHPASARSTPTLATASDSRRISRSRPTG